MLEALPGYVLPAGTVALVLRYAWLAWVVSSEDRTRRLSHILKARRSRSRSRPRPE